MSDDVQANPTLRAGSGGRPTREEAAARDRRILDTAAAMFERRGYEGTTIDALAEAAGVGKPTLYARFGDKGGLFAAVFRMRVEAVLAPVVAEATAAAEAHERADTPPDLGHVLRTIGMLMLQRWLLPDSIALSRVIVAEAERFPELARLSHTEGWLRCVGTVADLLRSYDRAGAIAVQPDVEEAADLFLSLIMGRKQRAVMLGLPAPDLAAITRRVTRCVDIFLNGVATRTAGPG